MIPLSHLIWLFKASKAIGRQDHQRVIELATGVLRKRPNDRIALQFAATHSDVMGDVESAKKFARRALAIDPDNFDLHCLMVRNLDLIKNKEEVIEHAKWMVSIAETTLLQDAVKAEKDLNTLGHLPFIKKTTDEAKQVLSKHDQRQSAMTQWAKNYLASSNE